LVELDPPVVVLVIHSVQGIADQSQGWGQELEGLGAHEGTGDVPVVNRCVVDEEVVHWVLLSD